MHKRQKKKSLGHGGVTLLPLLDTEKVPEAESPSKKGLKSIKPVHQISYTNKPTGTSPGEIEKVKAKEKYHRTGHEIFLQHKNQE